MLSRNKGSIFHLGEDGVEITKTVVSIREPKHMRPASEGIEGLRILIHHKEQGSNVVTKSSCSLSKGGLGFLKSCFLCKRELSPSKDVYMYRYSLPHLLVSTACHAPGMRVGVVGPTWSARECLTVRDDGRGV
ncbi:hypothetical protein B296_00036252 [Ensete ventricosum]|uniref:FLZ-type domain-containing protein n=1 Tax=Ensete ventricosum TaxID=4639 RepID=A0A426XBA8_ENSVE|nr:hypothetical protein B296_00036252 [Ensete ventricosum]